MKDDVDSIGEEELAKRELYARVFGTPDGKEVLKDIISRCYVLETIEPSSESQKEVLALRNFGLETMYLVGILDERNGNDFMARIVAMVH